MSDLLEQIHELEDDKAIGLLMTITEAQKHRGEFQTIATEELKTALGDLIAENTPAATEPSTDGDLARAALCALSEDDILRSHLETMITGPHAEAFVTPGVILSVGAVLVALQIGWDYKSKDGRKTFEKKPLAGKHFINFADKLFGWLKKTK